MGKAVDIRRPRCRLVKGGWLMGGIPVCRTQIMAESNFKR
jgi:hypothetical protein